MQGFDSAALRSEILLHSFLPMKYVLYAHCGAVLALAEQADGAPLLQEALGDTVALIPDYASALGSAKAAAEVCEAQPGVQAAVWANHGVLAWGETARAAFDSLAEIVRRAESYLEGHTPAITFVLPSTQEVEARIRSAAPIVRGLLAQKMTDGREALSRVILRSLSSQEIQNLLAGGCGKSVALMPPLFSVDTAITKPLPMWVDAPDYGDPARLRQQVSEAIDRYARAYDEYYSHNAATFRADSRRSDSAPRVVVMPGLGALCGGPDVATSVAVRDAIEATLIPRCRVGAGAAWRPVPESELFCREYSAFVRGKGETAPLAGRVALVTGAAGAIGAGIADVLLRNGCAVALADLPGEGLTGVFHEFRATHDELVMELPFDVTEPPAVADAFGKVILQWGGLDLIVSNAGIAYVSALAEMKLEAFRRLERVNIEGTFNILSECARLFALQACGGDVVLISTKNVFAPGARFGAYSATKAAAHQLARIASLEFAELGVRVNMVAPDAVFRHGARPSGLWAEVGPNRARSLGMSAEELESHYRRRSLLKTEVTAEHVGNAVLYFAMQRTPTTGATLPVDGGLPEATPR
jgi:NAD(P)-dependent dehydrogenase (short-subunit alcohol dehydrogenase family)/rhamnose utilization protein RhaD (predicted bifunctional aldolase and dehydrogenase)